MSKARDIADLDFNSPDIDGGNIDGATIGGTTPAAGSFSSMVVNGVSTLNTSSTVFANLNYQGATKGTIGTDGINIKHTANANMYFHINGQDRMLLGGNGDISIYDDSSNIKIFWDASSSRLGVGTDAPSSLLHLKGTANADDCKLYMMEDSNNGAFIKYDGATNTGELGGLTSAVENTVMSWSRAGSEVVFNENSASMDFRVESSDLTHALAVDADLNTVLIGENLPYEYAGLQIKSNNKWFSMRSNVGNGGVFAQPPVPSGGSGVAVGWNGSNGGGEGNFVSSHPSTLTGGLRFHDYNSTTGTYTELFRGHYSGTGQFSVNEGKADINFKVSSIANSHFLFVDAGLARLGIGTSGPKGSVHLKDITDFNGSDVYYVAQNTTANRNAGFKVMDESDNYTSSLTYDNGSNAGILTLSVPSGGSGQVTYSTTEMNIISNNSSAPMKLSTNSTERLRLNATSSGAVFNELGNDYDFRVESNTDTHALFLDAGNSRVGVNNSGPSFQLQIGRTNTANMGVGWMRMETFAVIIPSSGTHWYKVANYQAGNVMLQGQLFMSAARNGGANQTNGARTQHGSIAGYNGGVNTGDWGDLGTNYGHSGYYIEVGTDNHVYLRVTGSVYSGTVYCYFQGRANWAFDGSYVTSAP